MSEWKSLNIADGTTITGFYACPMSANHALVSKKANIHGYIEYGLISFGVISELL